METITIDKRLIPFLLQRLPARQVWMDYDVEGDVLYLSFAMPQQATDSVMGEDGNVYHYRGERLVGITILHASGAGTLGNDATFYVPGKSRVSPR